LDQQLRDCNAKIDEAEAYARAEGKRLAAKYEGRVRIEPFRDFVCSTFDFYLDHPT